MSKSAKKAEEVPVTAGIRGILRKHICDSMLDKVQSPYKILVMDVEASELINSCFKMHDIMEHGVTLVTPINKTRQPVKSCVAIYFLSPKAENMALLVNDWKDTQRMMYKEPHLFFTTAASDPVLAHLGGSNAVAQLKSLFDLRIEFHAPEPLFFNLKVQADMQALYGSTYSPIKVGEIGSKIASALLVAGERPTIRAYNSDLCKSLAAKVKTTLDMESAATANTSGVLIIVDRAIDMIAPLLHEYTYEAFVADNRPLIKDQLDVKTESGEAKKVLIDMDDNVWCLMRHKHLGQLGQELAARMQELKDKFPKLMEFSGSKATASTKDLGDAVRDLPAFNAMKQNISTHQYLVNDVMKVNTNGKLQALGEFEQCVVMGVNESGAKVDAKAALKIAADIVKSPDYDQSIKKRFCMLTVAALGPSYLEEVAKLLKPTDKTALEAVAKLFDVGAKDKMSRSKKSESEFFISSYKGYVKTIMEQAIAGTLDTTAFPIISGDAGGANGGASAADAAPAKGGGLFGGATRRPGTAGASKSSSAAVAANLDLGHGQLLPLTSKARVWVFIAGGATRSEIRAAYEVAAQLKREVILGSTSVVSSSNFAELVASMS